MYLAGVVFGGVGGSLPSPTSYLAGASAGVYALIAAHVSTLVMNWKVKIFNRGREKYLFVENISETFYPLGGRSRV